MGRHKTRKKMLRQAWQTFFHVHWKFHQELREALLKSQKQLVDHINPVVCFVSPLKLDLTTTPSKWTCD